MGRVSGACKFLGMICILSLLIQGSYAAEESSEANINLNYTINDTLNGTIIGTINGTINDAENGTVIGIISGTVNGSVNGTISSTRSKIDPLQWVLILPILAGYLLFLSWMCRFFDRMNFSLVLFTLIALIFVILSFDPNSSIISDGLIVLIILLIIAVILHEAFSKKGNENQGNKPANSDGLLKNLSKIPNIIWKKWTESNPIMCLHDIVRNFIVISTTLMWPLLLIYFYMNDIESVTFYGIEDVKFPVIIAASSIGVLSYLLLSIEEIFGQLIPEYKKMSIAWSYLRRILIAPFIALIIVYILPFNKDNLTSEISVFFFSFIAGFFTKAAEEWVYEGVKDFLPKASKEEFNSRAEKYDVEKSDFVTKLGLEKDLAYMLYNAKIRTIEVLASYDNAGQIRKKINIDTRNLGEGMGCPVKERGDRLGDHPINEIQQAIEKAKDYLESEESELVTKLKIDKELASKLYSFVNIKTIENLSTRNKTYIYNRLKTCNKNEDVKEAEIEDSINKALCYMALNTSDLVTELKMPRELAFKISYKAKIKSIKELKAKTAEEIHKDLAEFKEDVTIDKINEYKELAQKNFPE